MPAADVIHMQTQLVEELSMTERGPLVVTLDTFDRSQRGMKSGLEYDSIYHPAEGWFTQPYRRGRLFEYWQTLARVALPFYVDSRMHELVTAAAESLPDEHVIASDLPNPSGFMVIPGGITTIDLRGRMLVFNVVVWNARGGGVDVWWLTDKYDPRDQVNLEGRRQYGDADWARLPRLSPAHYAYLAYDEPVRWIKSSTKMLPPEISRDMKITRDPGTGQIVMAFPKGYSQDEINEWVEGVTDVPDPMSRWLVAVWRLMQQTIVDVDVELPPRQLRKQARKVNMRHDTVTVVMLRRRESTRGHGDVVEWSHRWLVRGHWRKQACKIDGVWGHRVIWIHPHIKGPEDAPLLVRDRVYSLAR